MKISEQKIKSIVRNVLKETSNTSVYHSLIKKLHQKSQPWTSHLYKDNDWSNFHAFLDDLKNIEGVSNIDCWCDNGGYESHGNGPDDRMPTMKSYKLHIHTVYDQQTGYDGIKGEIICHFCGTVSDPMSAYDMTANFWINKDKTELNESRDHPPTPGSSYPVQMSQEPGDVIRLIAGKYHLSPEDFNYNQNDKKVYYNPKKRKTVKRQKYSKPADMSIKDYYSSIVLKVNPKLKEGEDIYDDEVWMPVRNAGRYFKGEADYSFYEVSNHARLRIINLMDAEKSRILTPYPAPTRRAMQFHLTGSDEGGNAMRTCPDVKNIVADAFFKNFDPSTQRVVHKDGDWRNNNVDNLAVIDRGRRVKKEYNAIDETIDRVVNRYLR